MTATATWLFYEVWAEHFFKTIHKHPTDSFQYLWSFFKYKSLKETRQWDCFFIFFCSIRFGIGLLHNCESFFDFGFRICRDIGDQNLLPGINNTWSRQEILTLPFLQILEIIKRNSVRIFAKLSLSRAGTGALSTKNHLLKLPESMLRGVADSPYQRYGELMSYL